MLNLSFLNSNATNILLSLFTLHREFFLMKGLGLEIVFIYVFCHRRFESNSVGKKNNYKGKWEKHVIFYTLPKEDYQKTINIFKRFSIINM